MICTECGTQNEADYLFCMRCGAELASAGPNLNNDQKENELEKVPSDGSTDNSQIDENLNEDSSKDQLGGQDEVGEYPQIDDDDPPLSKDEGPNETNRLKSKFQNFSIANDVSKYISFNKLSYGKIDKLNFGRWIDGWADILEGAADLSDSVNSTFMETLMDHQFPGVNLSRVNITENGVENEKRSFHLIRDAAGNTIAVYIGAFGDDLFLTWHLFSKQSLKVTNIAGFLASATVLGTLLTLNQTRLNPFFWLLAVLGWTIVMLVVALIVGWVWFGDLLVFFLEKESKFIADDRVALNIAIHKSLLKTLKVMGIDTSSINSKQDFLGSRREVFR